MFCLTCDMDHLLKILLGLISLKFHSTVYDASASDQFRRVAYGYDPPKFGYPYTSQAAIVAYPKAASRKYCTGTIITSLAVLTSARCLDNQPKSVTVQYGNYEITHLYSAKGKQWFQHPNWASDGVNLGLILVDTPMKLSPDREPVTRFNWTMNSDEWSNTAKKVMLCGWGKDGTEVNIFKDSLRESTDLYVRVIYRSMTNIFSA